ncbi:response regulator [candidate division KSB1 bacterium]
MKKYNVLIADDEEDFLKMISIRMDSIGYGYSIVRNGIEVLEYCKKEIPDLIVLDVMMPKLDGIQTLHKLKADEKLKDIPVIILTAGRFDISEELDDLATANDFLLKTIDIKLVLQKIEDILKS